jgi:hypothetical protein
VAKGRWTTDRRSFLNSAKEACAVLAASNTFGPAVALVDAGARLADASGAQAAGSEPLIAPQKFAAKMAFFGQRSRRRPVACGLAILYSLVFFITDRTCPRCSGHASAIRCE